MTSVRPLCWHSDARLQALRERVTQRLTAWQTDWGACAVADVRIVNLGQAAMPVQSANRLGWAPVEATVGQPQLWVAGGSNPDVLRSWCEQVVLRGHSSEPVEGAPQFGEIARQLGRDSLAEMLARLLVATNSDRLPLPEQAPVDALPAEMTKNWSGAVHVQLHWGDFTLHLAGDVNWANALAGPTARQLGQVKAKPALQSPATALADRRVRLNVELIETDLALGDMLALRPGDVMTLRHPLDQPMLLRDKDGHAVARAHLGCRHDHKAIQLNAGEHSHRSEQPSRTLSR